MDTHFAARAVAETFPSRSRFRASARCGLIALLLALGGCASGGGIGKAVNRTLESVGLKDADMQQEEKRIPLRLYAGDNLNAGNDRRALAAVVKVYHLRSNRRFEQAPFDMFLDEDRERRALGEDLIAVNEIVLTPGARHEVEERLAPEAEVLGVVALFRAPADNRWRLAFDGRHKKIQEEGVTVGLHACAMTTSSAALITRIAGDPASLASVQCMSP